MNDKVDLSLDLTDADGGHPAHHAGGDELVGGVRLDGCSLQGVNLQHSSHEGVGAKSLYFVSHIFIVVRKTLEWLIIYN